MASRKASIKTTESAKHARKLSTARAPALPASIRPSTIAGKSTRASSRSTRATGAVTAAPAVSAPQHRSSASTPSSAPPDAPPSMVCTPSVAAVESFPPASRDDTPGVISHSPRLPSTGAPPAPRSSHPMHADISPASSTSVPVPRAAPQSRSVTVTHSSTPLSSSAPAPSRATPPIHKAIPPAPPQSVSSSRAASQPRLSVLSAPRHINSKRSDASASLRPVERSIRLEARSRGVGGGDASVFTANLNSVLASAQRLADAGDQVEALNVLESLLVSVPAVACKSVVYITAAHNLKRSGALSAAVQVLTRGAAATRTVPVEHDLIMQALASVVDGVARDSEAQPEPRSPVPPPHTVQVEPELELQSSSPLPHPAAVSSPPAAARLTPVPEEVQVAPEPEPSTAQVQFKSESPLPVSPPTVTAWVTASALKPRRHEVDLQRDGVDETVATSRLHALHAAELLQVATRTACTPRVAQHVSFRVEASPTPVTPHDPAVQVDEASMGSVILLKSVGVRGETARALGASTALTPVRRSLRIFRGTALSATRHSDDVNASIGVARRSRSTSRALASPHALSVHSPALAHTPTTARGEGSCTPRRTPCRVPIAHFFNGVLASTSMVLATDVRETSTPLSGMKQVRALTPSPRGAAALPPGDTLADAGFTYMPNPALPHVSLHAGHVHAEQLGLA